MDCPVKERRNTDLLLDYCAERLDRKAASELAGHLTSCSACAEWIRAQKQVWDALDVFEAAPVSPGFDRKLFERIAREERPRSWWSALWPERPAAASALSLALASLLLLAAFLVERPRPPVVAPAGAAHVETIDADRIEKALDDVEMLREVSVAGAPDPRSM